MSVGLGLGLVSLGGHRAGCRSSPARTSDVSGLTREGGYVAQSLGVADLPARVMIARARGGAELEDRRQPALSDIPGSRRS